LIVSVEPAVFWPSAALSNRTVPAVTVIDLLFQLRMPERVSVS
jgi:hypothetical protein